MDKALETMIANLPEKTGKALNEWFSVLSEHTFDKHSQGVALLKSQYGVTHGFANTIVTLYKQQDAPQVDLVETQYRGKTVLLPVYDALIQIVSQFGSDVTITPKKTSVSVIRKYQFALIKPATKSRVDLGLKLKGVEVQGRLEDSGPFGTMCTHRIQLHSLDDIDDDVKRYLALAYDMSV